MKTGYKSAKGKTKILALYEAKLADLNISYTNQVVETRFGSTHITITGSPDNPPLFLIHGSNGCTPVALETYPNLTERYQVFAVDVLAQPNKSAQTRLNMSSNDYGKWINELITHFKLEQVTLVGFSFGGLIILKTLLQDETRIKAAFLAAPAFIVNGNPLVSLFSVFYPMKRYMKTRKETYLNRFLDALFTERDTFALGYLAEVFLHFNMDFSPIPTIKKAEARRITTPITLYAAEKDIMFPGKKMIRRATRLFPSLKQVILLKDSKHVQNRTDNTQIENDILAAVMT